MPIFRDKVSGFTHMGGAVLAVVGTVFLCIGAKNGAFLASYLIYGLSLILLLAFSATYHLVSEKFTKTVAAFRKVDHSMIFVLIAGTYTPIMLKVFENNFPILVTMLSVQWGIVLVGVFLKIFFTGKFRWASTILYLMMGWAAIFVMKHIINDLSIGGICWLFGGGLSYTLGAVLYGLKWPKLWKEFNFHDIFHILILIGAACHYVLILVYC